MKENWEYIAIIVMALYIVITGFAFVFGAVGAIIKEFFRENNFIIALIKLKNKLKNNSKHDK
jgi:hypothetical protein